MTIDYSHKGPKDLMQMKLFFGWVFLIYTCLASAIEPLKLTRTEVIPTLSKIRDDFSDSKNFLDWIQKCRRYYEALNLEKAHDLQLGELKGRYKEIIELLWQLRLQTAKQYHRFFNEADPHLLIHYTAFVNLIRSLEEQLIEFALADLPSLSESRNAFEGTFPFTLMADSGRLSTQVYSPQKGDVILTRGDKSSSAFIAGLGDRQGQYSHLALIHETVDGRIVALESHLEVGNDIFPWSEFKTGKVKTVVYRHKDPRYGVAAADHIYRLLRQARQSGKKIPYDFKMKTHDHSALFCSELVRYGFELAKAPILPQSFFNSFYEVNSNVVEQLGVKKGSFFAPIDIELDPNFEMVAEWRDFSKTRLTRYYDAFLKGLFGLLEEESFNFSPTFFQKSLAAGLKLMRGVPGLNEPIRLMFPSYMPYQVLAFFFAINDLPVKAIGFVEKADEVYFLSHGHYMTTLELTRYIKQLFLKPPRELKKKFSKYITVRNCSHFLTH